MKVFIENEANSDQKNIYNEKTLEYRKTYTVARKYPYPYGFVLNTKSGDGDNLDCFIITQKPIKSGTIIDAEPTALMEQIEDGEEDHKILAILPGEAIEITDDIKKKLKDFGEHVFDHLEGKKMQIGNFYGKEAAEKHIEKCKE
jgi:inorganic pyrophosphatase